MFSKIRKINQYTWYEILRYFYEKIYILIYSLTNQKIISDQNNQSLSDNGNYVNFVNKCIEENKQFKNFKNNPIYRQILEHTTYKQGLDYLKNTDPNILQEIERFRINDNYGNPIKFFYKDLNKKISPSTLRYTKVLSDINKFFGKQFKKVVEIGCGYGGQYIIFDQYLTIENYILFDLTEVKELIIKNLKNYNLNSKYQLGDFNQNFEQIDLVISNYAFSELPINLQLSYLKNIISKSNHGYLTMNSGLDIRDIIVKQKNQNLHKNFENHLSLSQIKKYIPNAKIIDEEPLTGEGNYILIW